jgi:hypothetical protein
VRAMHQMVERVSMPASLRAIEGKPAAE